jgi:hypothetical protein
METVGTSIDSVRRVIYVLKVGEGREEEEGEKYIRS